MRTIISPPVDFLIITPLEEERDAILKHLPGYTPVPRSHEDMRVYYSATVQAILPGDRASAYSVVVCLSGMGRVAAACTTYEAISHWHPRYVLLVGIAGGLKSAGVKIGDILIAEQIADYESQKITKDGAEIRWAAYPVDQRLLEFARSFPASTWQAEIVEKRPLEDSGKPQRHLGTITTGDKVVGVNELLESFKRDHWPKLIGVEMEAGGVAASAHQSVHRPGFFMVRSVSDQAGNKSSKKTAAWRPYACDVAAAYAISMIRNGAIPVQLPSVSGTADLQKLEFPDELTLPATELSSNCKLSSELLTFSLRAVLADQFLEGVELIGAWSRRYNHYVHFLYGDTIPSDASAKATITFSAIIADDLRHLTGRNIPGSLPLFIDNRLQLLAGYLERHFDASAGGFGRRGNIWSRGGAPITVDLRHTLWALIATCVIKRNAAEIERIVRACRDYLNVAIDELDPMKDRAFTYAALHRFLSTQQLVEMLALTRDRQEYLLTTTEAVLVSKCNKYLNTWDADQDPAERTAIDNTIYTLTSVPLCNVRGLELQNVLKEAVEHLLRTPN